MTTPELHANTSIGKGKRKTKAVKVPLQTFLSDQTEAPSGFAVAKTLNWADDEDDEDEEKYYDNKTASNQVILPTVPKSIRTPDFDVSKVPDRPPYKAYLGNLPYEVTEEDIQRFFKKLAITNVTLIRDGDRGKIKGVGFAEFEDRENLIEALQQNGDSLKNRYIRVSLSEDNERPSRGGFGRDRNDDREDRTAGDWRSGARERDQPLLSRNGSDYQQPYESQSYRGRFSYDRNERRGEGGFERGSFQRNDRDFRDRDSRDFRDRDSRDFRDRDNRDRDFGSGRGGGGGFRDRDSGFRDDRSGGFGGYDRRDRYRDNKYSDNRDNRDYRDRSDRSDKNSEAGDRPSSRRYDSGFEPRSSRHSPSALSTDSKSNDDIPKERPKLKLQPRSKPLESDAQEVSNSAIFGGAKPVDTAAREREIEEKLSKGETKVESKGESKSEPKDEPKGEPKGDPKVDPKVEPKGETASDPESEPKDGEGETEEEAKSSSK